MMAAPMVIDQPLPFQKGCQRINGFLFPAVRAHVQHLNAKPLAVGFQTHSGVIQLRLLAGGLCHGSTEHLAGDKFRLPQ